MTGPVLLALRVLLLGFERPAFKAISAERNPVAATAVAYGIALLVLVVLLCFPGLRDTSLQIGPVAAWLPYAVASGIVAIAGYLLYTMSLRIGEVSIVSPLYSSGLVFIFVLDVLFGRAQFGWRPLAGVLLVTLGIALLNGLKANALTPRGILAVMRRPGALYMLLCALALGVTRVIDANASGIAPALPYAVFATLPTVLFCLGWLAWRSQLRDFADLLAQRPLQSLAAAGTHIGGYLTLLACLRVYNASVVEPVSQLATMLSVAAGALFFREKIADRLLPAACVIAGSLLVLL